MAQHKVFAAREHFEQQARATPLAAIEELIWNGLDAGGPSVEVRLAADTVGEISSIEVEDKGAGIHPKDLAQAFGTIGNSLKVGQKQTLEGRQLHGKEGRGRFKALSLGRNATWETTYEDRGKHFRYQIVVQHGTIDTYENSEPKEVEAKHSGTLVRIEGIEPGLQPLASRTTQERITERFALYLKDYPKTQIIYDGQSIDVDSVIDQTATFPIDLNGKGDATVTVIEWKFRPDARRLLFCDAQGFTWHEVKAGIHAPGFEFTAYLKTDKVADWQKEGKFALDELDPDISSVLEKVKQMLREHFRERLAAQAQEVVKQWQEDRIYPYTSEESSTPLKMAARQVFDIVAVKVNQYHDAFREGSNDAKRLTLCLFKEALENNPGSVQKILSEVLRLPKDLQDDLAAILDRTSFQSIIEAAKTVTRRLDTIQAFEEILFAEDWRKRLLERTQLHRLLVHHLWLFGEEYSLDADDESLREVLKKHIGYLGRSDLAQDVDVKLINGKEGIIDLMLSKTFQLARKGFEHLVLELKRPSVRLGSGQIKQIEEYAFAVSRDPRFSKENTTWTFMLLGNDFDDFAGQKAQSDNLPYGCIYRKGNLTIWIKQWADVLNEAKVRYEFFRRKLDVEASSEKGMAYLNENYAELLTGRGKRKGKESAKDKVGGSQPPKAEPAKTTP